jgi:hypothetical protein
VFVMCIIDVVEKKDMQQINLAHFFFFIYLKKLFKNRLE